MKKKIFIAILIMLLLAGGVGYVYLDSIITQIVLSTLNSQYGLRVEMENLKINATPGWVTIQMPNVYDAKSTSEAALADAGDIQLSINPTKIMSGKMDLQEIRSSELTVHLIEQEDKHLNWSDVIPRFLPKAQTIVAADAVSPPAVTEPSNKTPVPAASFKNFQLNFISHSGDASNKYNITFGELEHVPYDHTLTIQNLSASQNQESIAFIASAHVNNLFNEAQLLDFEVSGVQLNAIELKPGVYNCNTMMNAWMKVYDEIASLVPASATKSDRANPLPLGTMILNDVNITAAPAGGDLNAESSVNVKLKRLQMNYQNGQTVISGLELQEAGQSAVHIEGLLLQYDLKQNIVRSVDIQGAKVDVREGESGSFNLNRVVKRIQSLIESLIPKQSGKTAQAAPNPLDVLQTAGFNNALLTYHTEEGSHHSLKWIGLGYSKEANLIILNDFSVQTDGDNATEFLAIPKLAVVPVKDSQFKQWDSIQVDSLKSSLTMTPEGMDINPYIAGWVAFATSFSTAKASGSSTASTKMPFSTVQITNADFKLTDQRMEPPLTHHLSGISLSWKADQNQSANITVQAEIQSPGKGTITFTGTSARELYPVTVSGKPVLTLENIAAYETFYQSKMPVKINKSGLKLEGDLKITGNQLDSSIDLYLLQPEFAVSTGNLPVNVDSRAVVTTLDSLKDQDGVIAFQQNKITGDITNPQFSFGRSIANILTTVILKKGVDIITLPKDMAETGVNVIKKGAESVGNLLDGILKPKN